MPTMVNVSLPHTSIPPYRVDKFDLANPYGKRCVFAWFPGWDRWHGDTAISVIQGDSVSIGQEIHFKPGARGSGGLIYQAEKNFGAGIGVCKAGRADPPVSDSYQTLSHVNSNGDVGIKFPNPKNLTLIGIAQWVGSGLPPSGSSDPRIFSQDTGYQTADHDIMLGTQTSGTKVRTRMRRGGTTYTTVIGTQTVQNDAVNLIAATVSPTGTAGNTYAGIHHLREDGGYEEVIETSVAGGYDPRTNTTMGIGGTQQDDVGNPFDGYYIAILAFDGRMYESDFRSILANPAQILEPMQIPIWVPAGAGGTETPQAVAGVLAPSGGLVRKTLKATAGVVAPSGGMARQTNKNVAGTLPSSGGLTRKTLKAVAGVLGLSGTVDTTVIMMQAVAGVLAPSGGIVRKTLKAVAGVLAPSGAIVRKTSKALAGTFTPDGALPRKTEKAVAGVLGTSGTVATMVVVVQAVAGALSPIGVLTRMTRKLFSGGVTPVGDTTKKTSKNLAGGVTPNGDLTKLIEKALFGSVTPSGDSSPALRTSQAIAGVLGPIGGITTLFIPFVPSSGIAFIRKTLSVVRSMGRR